MPINLLVCGLCIIMENLNDDQGIDNQVYYDEIIKYLQDPTRARSTADAQWVKTQAANYFVCILLIIF